jgi:hypothetical protein
MLGRGTLVIDWIFFSIGIAYLLSGVVVLADGKIVPRDIAKY